LEVATSVADALSRAGFRAVLTGGGCASIYTKGVYQSVDLDFILQRASTQAKLVRIFKRRFKSRSETK